jgi:hypothetical protein
VVDKRKTVNEKVSTALDNTTDDIPEARDDSGGDDAEEDGENEESGRAWRGSHSFWCAVRMGDRTKCLHVSATLVQRHRPSDVVEAALTRV